MPEAEQVRGREGGGDEQPEHPQRRRQQLRLALAVEERPHEGAPQKSPLTTARRAFSRVSSPVARWAPRARVE